MTSFLHNGDLGDIIYCLPSIRALGGGVLYLDINDTTKFNIIGYQMIKRLLIEQDYIEDVKLYVMGNKIDYDLTEFRRLPNMHNTNLCKQHLTYCGLPSHHKDTKWLGNEVTDGNSVIINRSVRYHAKSFNWKGVLEAYPEAKFVGADEDYDEFVEEFGQVERLIIKDFKELADYISRCKIFIGNQSLPYAIAEGLKKKAILEVSEFSPNCIFEREGLKYGFN